MSSCKDMLVHARFSVIKERMPHAHEIEGAAVSLEQIEASRWT